MEISQNIEIKFKIGRDSSVIKNILWKYFTTHVLIKIYYQSSNRLKNESTKKYRPNYVNSVREIKVRAKLEKIKEMATEYLLCFFGSFPSISFLIILQQAFHLTVERSLIDLI